MGPRCLFLCLTILASFCARVNYQDFHNEKLDVSWWAIIQGERASQKYCSACHVVPKPQSLAQEEWEYVLAYMGLFYGISSQRRLSFDPGYLNHYQIRRQLLQYIGKLGSAGFMPQRDFSLIRNYYLAMARVEPPRPLPLYPYTKLFRQKKLVATKAQALSLIAFHNNELYLGDAANRALEIHNLVDKSYKRIALPSPPVRLQFGSKGGYISLIGDLLGTSPQSQQGELWFWSGDKLFPMKKGLGRIAGVYISDIDGDSCHDALELDFGYPLRGGIWFHPSLCTGGTERLPVLTADGAVDILPQRYNQKDGFFILRAGADESLEFLFYEKGIWHRKTLLRFPPTMGFTRLLSADFNLDNQEDFLLIAGDNADAGPYNPIKEEAGIYIYSLRGENLEKTFFFHYPGAFNAAIGDFNMDRRPDIAVASYYPDLRRNPPQSAILLLNEGNYHFSAQTLVTEGRFSVVFSADINKDGASDLLLGQVSLPLRQKVNGQIYEHPFRTTDALLYLENTYLP